MKPYQLIFLRNSKVILSKKHYADLHNLQNDFNNYMTSLDFDTISNVIEYLSLDYQLSDLTIKRINEIESSTSEQIELTLS